MLAPFAIHEPATVGEASRLLLDLGAEAAAYAGGTELLLLMKEGLIHYPHLVNIKTIPGLDGIDVSSDDSLTLGALVTHRRVATSPAIRDRAPLLAEMAARVANTRVRSAGTLGGNLCFGEPHSDPATLLLAWDAVVELRSTEGARSLPLAAFLVGLLQTARQPHEILTAIQVPPLPPTMSGAYEKFSLHERPTVTVAALLDLRDDGLIQGARLAVGSVGPVPIRVPQAEALLAGAPPSPRAFAQAAALAAAAVVPADDLYGSEDYKRHLVGVLAARALARAAGPGIAGEQS